MTNKMLGSLGRVTRAGLLLLLAFCVWAGASLAQSPDSAPPASPPTAGVSPAPLPAIPVAAPASAPQADPAKESQKITAWDMMQQGGPIMWVIAACSFVLVVFVFERFVTLRRSRVIPQPFVKRFISQLREGKLDSGEALRLCEGNSSPVSEVFAAAVKKWGKSSVEVEQAIIDSGERVANNLRKYIRIFNLVYTLGPLLGLLGTVIGMIITFNTVYESAAVSRPKELAHGISVALLNTAFGLMVAIPGLVFYMFFIARVDQLVTEIDALGQQVVNAIASDGWKEPPARSRNPDRRPKAAKTVPDDEDEDDDE